MCVAVPTSLRVSALKVGHVTVYRIRKVWDRLTESEIAGAEKAKSTPELGKSGDVPSLLYLSR